MAATQLIDIAFVPLLLSGVETIDSSAGVGYGKAVIHADYTHSLIGTLIMALIAGWAAAKAWGKRGGITIGAVVFSHWLLDLLVHRADMPVLPGNAGNLPLLGFGLWTSPALSALVELALIAAGFVLYVVSLIRSGAHKRHTGKAWTAAAAMGLLLGLSLATDYFGI
jgi:membrane-bound metal-dependent hydrolase YbcI (DUF457 family)